MYLNAFNVYQSKRSGTEENHIWRHFCFSASYFALPTIENNDNSALDIEDIGENGWWVIIRDGVQKTIEVLELSGHFWQKE